ncbi:aldose 1-epimerase family protein [Microbacterium foliorum]|uniref:aldose 1-epimerase family protein n=1 Tax=Microbacterium foliorum TaxID=104336 RepID=UPI001E1655BB|nr:aldose 1-epimerase family protein [Microbacterium foliorum]CAH0225497.1 Aldose 1-epimerase [Microbacterium foliorum]CAH0227880.1 Aldose 1-epimerase [Microbacterium foliorum]
MTQGTAPAVDVVTAARLRSGRQLRIASHGYEAVIASVGASLRVLTIDGRDLVVPFDADEVRPGYRGTTLAPWPNRIVDGRYTFGGVEHRLALTEPTRGQALHGLLAWTEFEDRLVLDDRVVLAAVIEPQTGYPFRVEVETEYRLDADGLHQTVTAHNLGADAAPWGTGPHPYLVAGSGRVDDWTLTLPASDVLTVTPDRLSPVAVEGVTAHPQWDFRTARPIADVFIDHAFTGLAREGGVAEVRVVTDAGTGVAMTFDERCPWVQVHTADNPGIDAIHRIGLAVEPMTCPPDAFNSGTDLVVLEPGDQHSASWRIAAI